MKSIDMLKKKMEENARLCNVEEPTDKFCKICLCKLTDENDWNGELCQICFLEDIEQEEDDCWLQEG